MKRSTSALGPQPEISSGSSPLTATQFGSLEQCHYDLTGATQIGSLAGESFQGTLSFALDDDGAIDAASIAFADGTTLPVVGQAAGRSVRFRIGSDPDRVITLAGAGEFPIDACTGEITGSYTGPGLQNIGVWTAVARQGE
ncbi:MAG: hypothetical protein KF883_12375 [Thermomicrobiales bacterium]|nr:hypothetical protein [Thermomicrobiales bacterium]